MTTRNIYELAQTWNNGAVDFTAIKMNVTDTASGAGSKLLDLQVGGSSKFSIRKDGRTFVNGGAFNDPGLRIGNNGIADHSSGHYFTVGVADGSFYITTNRVGVPFDTYYGFSSDSFPTGNADVRLYRDAANTLALRNSTNAQAFNIYNTYTDASNYERGCIKWTSNELVLGTENAGTGTARGLKLSSQGVTATLTSASGFTCSSLIAGLNVRVSATGIIEFRSGATVRNQINAPSDGVLNFRNWANTAWARLDCGNITLSDVPTSDPAIAGRVWNDSGTLKISAG